MIDIASQSQQELPRLLGTGLESGQSPLPKPTTIEEKKHTSDHELEGVEDENKVDERLADNESSARRANLFSASPKPAKRRRRFHSRLLDRPLYEDEAEYAPDFSRRTFRERKRVARRQTDSVQSVTVPEGSWEIVKIVRSRQSNNRKEYRVRWKSTWVAEEDMHAARLLRRFKKHYSE